MKKVTYYVIELENHRNGQWYGSHKEPTLAKAKKAYKRFLGNVKGDRVMADMQSQMRIRKITEELLCQNNAF